MNLQSNREFRDLRTAQTAASSARGADFDLRWMLNSVLQSRWTIAAVPLIFMLVAVVFVAFRPASFTASTQLQLTNLRLTFIREDAFFAETHPDPSFLETQLQIIRSDRVATSVLNSLQMVPPNASSSDRAKALEELRRSFSVERAGLSNVVQISHTAQDPEMAARIANEFARAYVAEQNSARLDTAQAGSSWLRERLREVGPKSRVIAEAMPPQHKSNIRGIFVIAGAGAIGGVLGVVGVLLWRSFDRRILTPEGATAATGVPCLGTISRIELKEVPQEQPMEPLKLIEHAKPVQIDFLQADPVDEESADKTEQAPKAKAFAAADRRAYVGGSRFAVRSPLEMFAVDHPRSEVSQTLRNVRAACQECFDGKGLRTIAVTSTFAGEGRSTVAANLALSLAASGKSILLIDGDVSDPGLSRSFGFGERRGLIDYLKRPESQLSKYVVTEQRTKLNFLPVGGSGSRNGGMVWTNRLERLLAETVAYEYVIFDMPTLSELGDIRTSARYLDAFLLVIGWNNVSSDSIHVGVNSAGGVSERLLGTVLNNVNAKEARWMLSPQTAFAKRQQI